MDKTKQFVIWLDGYIEAVGKDGFNISKTNVVRNKLNDLFEHVAEPVKESKTLEELGQEHGFLVKPGFPNHLNGDWTNNEEIKLNLKELKLLKFFLQNPNELLSHDRIYDFVWDYDEEYSDNSLRTYIKNLRKILGKDKIVSFKKLGYRFIQE